MTFELTSTSTVRVPEIRYSSTVSTSTEYEYPSPASQALGGDSQLPEHHPLAQIKYNALKWRRLMITTENKHDI